LFSLTAIRNAASSPSWRIPAWKTAPEWPGWLTYLQWLAIAIFIVQIGVPLVSLASSIGEWNNLVTTVATAHREIFFSFWINIAAALLCVPLAVATARELVYVKKWEKLLWVLVIIPLAIPPSLTGIGLITIWNQPQIHGVYGSSLMPILAGISRFAPLAVIVMVAQFRRLDPMLIDAARVLRTSGWQMWRQIWLPMLAPGLLAAAGIVFALNLGELGATLLVAPPGQATLTIRIYNFLHYGASGTVAGLCLLMAAAILIAGAIAALMLIKWSDISSKITVRRK
jgi:iron(III) transport system permease protein